MPARRDPDRIKRDLADLATLDRDAYAQIADWEQTIAALQKRVGAAIIAIAQRAHTRDRYLDDLHKSLVGQDAGR